MRVVRDTRSAPEPSLAIRLRSDLEKDLQSKHGGSAGMVTQVPVRAAQSPATYFCSGAAFFSLVGGTSPLMRMYVDMFP